MFNHLVLKEVILLVDECRVVICSNVFVKQYTGFILRNIFCICTDYQVIHSVKIYIKVKGRRK